MSDSLRPRELQPTRLLLPWDFPGKSTGVGCHCLLHDEYLLSSYYMLGTELDARDLEISKTDRFLCPYDILLESERVNMDVRVGL